VSFIANSRKSATAIVWLMVAAHVAAQESEFEQMATLSSQALIAAVVAQNHHLRALGAGVEAARLRIEPAIARPDPMLSYTIWPNSIGSNIGTRQGAQLSQAFRWPGKRGLTQTVSEQHVAMAVESRAAAQLTVVAAAKSAFSEWHYLDRAIAINTSTQTLLSELIRIAETNYASGRGLQQDVLQAEVEHVLLEQQRLVLDQQRRSLRATINELLNRAPDQPLPPPAPLAPPSRLPGVETVRAATATTHPEIRRLEATLAAELTSAELEEKSSLPDLNAFIGYSDAWDEVDKRLQLGVSINLPIGRSRRRAERDAARADARQTEHALEGQRITLLAALEAAYAEVEESEVTFQLYGQRLLPLAQDTLDAAIADYQSGASEFINVINAERQKLATEQGRERALADYWRRRAELDRITGVDNE